MSEITLDAIHDALFRINRKIRRVDVQESSSLIEDFGLDSVRFVELAFVLEDVFELDAFPMDEWAASEMARVGKRFTVASLADRLRTLRQKHPR
ncbi:MAG: acyl carrier protein [Polyangiaceae bacterium]